MFPAKTEARYGVGFAMPVREASMLDAVRLLSGYLGANPGARTEPATGLTQSEINALPSIMGPVSDPDTDSTARVDRAGHVYLWESGYPLGLWVHAGYVRHGRPRFGQVIDPNDIQWFELGIYKKKLLQAKSSVKAVRLPGQDDTWDVAKEARGRDPSVQNWSGEGGGGAAYGAPDDADIDIT